MHGSLGSPFQYGADSLATAYLRCDVAVVLISLSDDVADGPGQDEALKEVLQASWAALVVSAAVLQARHDSGTLLPGNCRATEVSFYAHMQ